MRRGRLRPLAAPRFHTRKKEARLPRPEGAPEMGGGGEARFRKGDRFSSEGRRRKARPSDDRIEDRSGEI